MDVNGIAPFELYAIKYARHSGRRAQDNYIGTVDFHDAESDLDYFVWVARRGSETYVIDTGFEEQAAQERGRELLMRVQDGLALVGAISIGIYHALWVFSVALNGAAVAIVLMFLLRVIVMRTKIGTAMRAVSMNMGAASLMGIDVDRTIVITFMIGGAMAVFAVFWKIVPRVSVPK